jgi:hypothetical protein
LTLLVTVSATPHWQEFIVGCCIQLNTNILAIAAFLALGSYTASAPNQESIKVGRLFIRGRLTVAGENYDPIKVLSRRKRLISFIRRARKIASFR